MPLCDEVYGLVTGEVPDYLGLSFMQAGMGDTDETDNDAIRYVGTACSLGYFARAVEFNVLRLDEVNENLADFLVWSADEGAYGDDWFATMNGAASTLANASESTAPPTAETDVLLAPEGMGDDARKRFAGHLLLALMNSDEASSDVGFGVLMRAWRVGYYLRACDMALPNEAILELREEST